jgi:hypothetical protein
MQLSQTGFAFPLPPYGAREVINDSIQVSGVRDPRFPSSVHRRKGGSNCEQQRRNPDQQACDTGEFVSSVEVLGWQADEINKPNAGRHQDGQHQ